MTLADLLNRLDEVSSEGDGYLAVCPGHADSKPSLRLAIGASGKVLLKCRAGCTSEHVMDSLGLTMSDLTHMTPGDVDVKPATSTALPATPGAIAGLAMRLDGYTEALVDSVDEGPEAAFAYARSRFGLSDDDIDRLGLGYTDDLGGDVPRLVVPFRTPDGVARNFQGRALTPDARVRWQGPHSPEGGSWSPLGWFSGNAGWSEVIVCEGPGDALTASAAGYDTIGVAGAARVNNAAIVDEIATWIGDRPAIVAGDGDPAGRRFSATLAKGLTERGVTVTVLDLPDGVDLNDWRLQDPAKFQVSLIKAIQDTHPVTSKDAKLAAWDEDKYSLTDLGGARFLRDYISGEGSGVRYNEETGFYVLDGGVWRRDDRQRIRTYAQAVADLLRELARDSGFDAARDGAEDRDKKRASRFNRYAAHAQTSKGLDAMIRELQAVEGVPIRLDEFDRHDHLLAVKNGVVDLRSGALLPHDPALLITRRIEHDFHPDARAPRWAQFLREVFPNHPGLPAYMQRLTGYGITGSTDEQCFVVHVGKGGNGKSVYTEVLTDIFRDITVTTPFSTFESKPNGGIPNDIAALNGARLVFASEGEAGKQMNESLMKRVTGRDMLSARFMRKEFFEFRPKFLLSLSTNSKPAFRGQDEGLWRRVKLVPWERNFAPSERDPKLHLKLLAEAEGILAWAVAGAVAWYAAHSLEDPAAIQDATKEYRVESDVLEGFLPGVYVKEEGGRIEATVVFKAFQEYADENNYLDLKRWSSRALYKALEERGHPRKRSTGGKFVVQGLKRARQTDSAPEWAAPGSSVHSPTEGESPSGAMTGADLDDLL